MAHEEGLVRVPNGLGDAGAASITCAGVTAWNALFVQGAAKPGSTVLILGTGGVAFRALQLASAAGLHPIVTSSGDEKLARAEALGARALASYRRMPEWQDAVLRLTGRQGVDVVLEVGGESTLPRSIAATRFGGSVIVIGGLSGFGDASIEPGSLIAGTKRPAGVFVGSRSTTEDLVRFMEVKDLNFWPAHPDGFVSTTGSFEQTGSSSSPAIGLRCNVSGKDAMRSRGQHCAGCTSFRRRQAITNGTVSRSIGGASRLRKLTNDGL